MAVRKRHATGYTLIELLAVLAIASALLVIAIPVFRTQVENSRMSAAATDLLGTLMSAKSEAIGRSNPVMVCVRNDDADECADSGQWENGWLSFVDEDDDGVLDADEEILQIHPPLTEQTTARASGGLTQSVIYRPNGRTNLTQTENLVICDRRSFDVSARVLIVSILGKVSILKTNESGVDSCLRS